MRKTTAIAVTAAFVLGGLVSALALLVDRPAPNAGGLARSSQPAWAEVRWPFLMDEWGQGRAFRCKAADCGTEINLYVRAKIGFCNCTTGVADDAELERLSDFPIVGNNVLPQGDGRPILIGWMKGRGRAYTHAGDGKPEKSALSFAFNDQCDAIVATAVLDGDSPTHVEPSVIEFLNSRIVLRWARVSLGL